LKSRVVQKGHHVSGTKVVACYELVGNVAGKAVGCDYVSKWVLDAR